jgi:hypothetical protein
MLTSPDTRHWNGQMTEATVPWLLPPTNQKLFESGALEIPIGPSPGWSTLATVERRLAAEVRRIVEHPGYS